ncbi:hypothetical protein [Chlorogloeopsis fritschii]|uniref:hypothetical protein n=1 Tax=Chlorogloeopsis fritschii TaxID=1124 RepID=UPI0023F375DE|nr:hypothetical protein [Chlorogloeopsis fritschii]
MSFSVKDSERSLFYVSTLSFFYFRFVIPILYEDALKNEPYRRGAATFRSHYSTRSRTTSVYVSTRRVGHKEHKDKRYGEEFGAASQRNGITF